MQQSARWQSPGFTLVELLIVVALIAILASIGTVVYRGITQSARDSARKSDVEAIAKAYEVKYASLDLYPTLSPSDFSLGSVPQAPGGGDYYSVTDGLGFKTCAKLESYPGEDQYCNIPSRDCFCKTSIRDSIQKGTTLYGSGVEIGTGGINNLISNSSFENDSSGWNFFLYALGNGTGSITNERAYLGSSSYKIEDTGGVGEVAVNYSGGLTFVAGSRYRYSAWVYSTTPRAALQGQFGGGWISPPVEGSGILVGDGSGGSFIVRVPPNKLNQWYPISYTDTAGGVIDPELRCGAFYGSGVPGEVYCDGIVVEQVP